MVDCINGNDDNDGFKKPVKTMSHAINLIPEIFNEKLIDGHLIEVIDTYNPTPTIHGYDKEGFAYQYLEQPIGFQEEQK